VWGDIWPNLPGLLGANLLFLLWCSPYALFALFGLPELALLVAPVTLGPGAVGLLFYVGKLTRDQPASFWRDSLRGACSRFVPGSLLAAATATALVSHSIAFANAAQAGMTGVPFFLWVGQVLVLLCLALLHVHSFALVSVYGNGLWDAVRNAFILSFAHPIASLAMLSLFVLSYVLIRAIGWGPMIVVPAVIAVFSVNTTVLLVEKHQPH